MTDITGLDIMRELTLESILLRISLAILLGGIIGFERGMKNRPAGLRTYMLVSLGACVVALTNVYIVHIYQTGDPVRMTAQVISGIGFLGAGTIIVTSKNQIKGLTTAAGLWTSACIGISIGFGFYEVALIAGFAVFAILSLLQFIDIYLHKNARFFDVYIELKKGTNLRGFLKFSNESNLKVTNIQMHYDNYGGDKAIAFIATIKTSAKLDHAQIVGTIRAFEGVQFFEEL